MLFNSYIFLFLFLPVTLCLYYAAGRTQTAIYSKLVLLLASYIFVAYADPHYAVILFISSIINYCFNVLIKSRPQKAHLFAAFGIVFNLLLLCFFKYANFFISSFNHIFHLSTSSLRIVLPLGISFYSFQQIAFLVDNFRGEVSQCGILDYLLFTSYFPKVIQGPITYHSELLHRFQENGNAQFNLFSFSSGLMIFAIGLSKKVLLADNFGKIVDYGFDNILSLNSFEALLSIIGYTMQIYFDFSGYCDMAIGISKMLNIDLPVNFNSPYKALNINDFWKRWHITLTRFLTKYIYIPLGGNRQGILRTYFNILIVFLVSGLWHGVGSTFFIWGLLHGVASILHRILKPMYGKLPKFLQWLLTFLFVSIAWTFFRAHRISDAFLLFERVFSGGFGASAELKEILLQPAIINIITHVFPFDTSLMILFGVIIAGTLLLQNSNSLYRSFRPSVMNWVFTYLLLMLSIISISGVSTFLYSNF